MATMTKTLSGDTNADLAALMNDMSSLKRDLAALAGHLKSDAVAATGQAAEQLSEEAQRLYDSMAAQGKRSMKVVSQHVEEQPIQSLLIAFAVGFISSRLLSR